MYVWALASWPTSAVAVVGGGSGDGNRGSVVNDARWPPTAWADSPRADGPRAAAPTHSGYRFPPPFIYIRIEHVQDRHLYGESRARDLSPLRTAVSPVPPERADVIRCDTTSVPVARAL